MGAMYLKVMIPILFSTALTSCAQDSGFTTTKPNDASELADLTKKQAQEIRALRGDAVVSDERSIETLRLAAEVNQALRVFQQVLNNISLINEVNAESELEKLLDAKEKVLQTILSFETQLSIQNSDFGPPETASGGNGPSRVQKFAAASGDLLNSLVGLRDLVLQQYEMVSAKHRSARKTAE